MSKLAHDPGDQLTQLCLVSADLSEEMKDPAVQQSMNWFAKWGIVDDNVIAAWAITTAAQFPNVDPVALAIGVQYGMEFVRQLELEKQDDPQEV